jgi:uncharacterized membrane protein
MALALLAFAHAAWFLWITYTQYQSHHVYIADVGVYDTMLAGPRYGYFFREPLQWNTPANWLGVHFAPIMILLMGPYLIIPHVMVFLSALVLSLAVAGFVVGWLAWRHTGSWIWAIGFSLLFHWNHFVASMHLANHHESLALPWMMLLLLGAARRSPWMMVLGALGALATKEDYVLYVLAFGVHLVFLPQWRRWGIGFVVGAILWALLATWMMKLAGQDILHAADHKPLVRYAGMGSTKGEVLAYMATHPLDILQRIFRWPLVVLLASVAFLPLLDWRSLWMFLAAASVFLVADDPLVRDLHYYYSYSAIPFLFYGAIRGAAVLQGWLTRIPTQVAGGISAALLGVLVICQAISPTRTDGFRRGPFEVTPRHRLANEIVRLIPPEAAVGAQYDLYVKVPHRPVKLPLRLEWIDEVDYIFYDTLGRPADLVGEEKRAEREILIPRILSDEFETVFEADGYVLRRRRVTVPPLSP